MSRRQAAASWYYRTSKKFDNTNLDGFLNQPNRREPTYYYEVRIEPKPVLRSYIAAAYDLCNELTDSELEQMGHDRKTGRIRLLHALETVDALADYSEEAATEEFGNYMDAIFPNVTIKPEFVNARAARWCGM